MGFQAPIEKHVTVPEGEYDATVIEVEPRTGGIDSNGFWLWKWEITDPATGEPVEVARPSSPKLTTGTHAGQWIRTLTGKSVDEYGQVFDFTLIEGEACRLRIDVEETKSGTFNRIIEIMPPSSQGTPDDAPI